MRRSFLTPNQRSLAFVVFALAAFIASSGSGPASVVKRSLRAAPPVPSVTFTFLPVDYSSPPPSNTNVVTGINQDGNIVGVYGSGCSASDTYASWISTQKGPPWSTFKLENYSGSSGTYLTSLDTDESNHDVAGWICPQTPLGGTSGVIGNTGAGTWTIVRPKGTGTNASTELLALNDWITAVGYYTDSTGVAHPYAVSSPGLGMSYFSPQDGNAKATGINTKGDVTGVMPVSGNNEGWYYEDGAYFTPFLIPGSTSTTPSGINWQDNVVGTYVASGVQHGFFLQNADKGPSEYQTVDYPGAKAGSTVVTSVNNHNCITGSYKDSTTGIIHGFVGMPTTIIKCDGTKP